ncbi:MAG TPA: DUF6152 family protein [Terriglobia bacterium]|nr:DUF6152 family protein [Terriglobia bacterium]
MTRKWLVPIVAVVAMAGGRALAHHSFAATYFEDKTTQIEGKLVQFQFRNPHSFVQVEVKAENGETQRWSIEWGGASQLGTQGVTSETLKYGDIVTISGNPGRVASDHRIRMVSLHRKSDGFGWGQRPGETFN